MNAKQIIQEKIYLPETIVLEERPFDETYSLVEIKTQEGQPFKLFYYVVNLETQKIYYGGYELPDSVNVERVKQGKETPVDVETN